MGNLIPDPAKYEVDDLIVDLAPQRVSRAGTVIRLQGLSFDLLVTLVRAAPSLVTFEQLGERVWPGLVVTPETIVQRVKLLRSALGDNAHAPRYIQGVRGRGYRLAAHVRPLMEEQGNPESIVPPSCKEGHAGIQGTGAAAVSSHSATPSAARRLAKWARPGWIGGTLIMAALLAASWPIVHHLLQDEIAHDIDQQIQVKLTPKPRGQRIQAHTVDPEAYDAYLMGTYWVNQLTPEGVKKGCPYFQKATAKDPSYASAYVGLAVCQNSPGKLRELVIKALVLDPSLAEAHTWLATDKLMTDWDWSGAEAEYKRAIALKPGYAPAHRWYSFYLVAAGRLDEALWEIERAQELDPYSASVTEWLGQVLYHARRYDDALREIRRGSEMYPDSPLFFWDMADVYEQKKMFPEAFAARQHALRIWKDPGVTALGEVYQRWGYKGCLLKLAESEQAQNPPGSAHFYALLNDESRAIGALQAAYNKHMGTILFIRSAPELDSIRSSPRYRDLVRRIGFPQADGAAHVGRARRAAS